MKLFFAVALFALNVSVANATVHIVTCQNFPSHFIPVTVFAEVGDTIRWVWKVGVHIVGPANASDIPSGASMWNAPIDVGNLAFEHVVDVAGDYHYQCHPATPHFEDAYLKVTDPPPPTAVQQHNSDLAFTYLNLGNGKSQLLIDQISENSKVEIYNLKGQVVYRAGITNTRSNIIDLSDQAKGLYLLKFYSGQAVFTKKIVIL